VCGCVIQTSAGNFQVCSRCEQENMAAVLWHAANTLEQQHKNRALVLLLPAAANRPGGGWGRPSASGCQELNTYLLGHSALHRLLFFLWCLVSLMELHDDYWCRVFLWIMSCWLGGTVSYPDSRRRSSILPSSADIISNNQRWCEGRLPTGQWGHVKPFWPGIFSPMGQMDIAWDHLGEQAAFPQ